MSDFVKDQNEETLEIVDANPMWNKDPFLRIKRDVGVATIRLDKPKQMLKKRTKKKKRRETFQ